MNAAYIATRLHRSRTCAFIYTLALSKCKLVFFSLIADKNVIECSGEKAKASKSFDVILFGNENLESSDLIRRPLQKKILTQCKVEFCA